MMKLATTFKSKGSISGQLLVGAQDLFMGSAKFSTVAQKASTIEQKPSTVAQKPSTYAQKPSTYAQKPSTFAQKPSTFAQKPSNVAQRASTGGRICAEFKLFKGKAALAACPIAPTFTKNEAGDLFLKRSGCIMMSFAPSIGERKYDWQRKEIFAMSPTEVGSLVSLGPGGSLELFHDPAIQTSNAGQVRKSLQVQGNPDGKCYFIALSVADNIKKTNERLMIPVTPGEFSVLRTSFSFALPHIMGWDRYSNSPPTMKAAEYSSNSGRKAFDPEWDR